ncbi:MAG: hypothetical protein ACH0QD_11750 [Tepidibacillus sp.]
MSEVNSFQTAKKIITGWSSLARLGNPDDSARNLTKIASDKTTRSNKFLHIDCEAIFEMSSIK